MIFAPVVILVVFKNTLWLAISVKNIEPLWVGADKGSVLNSGKAKAGRQVAWGGAGGENGLVVFGEEGEREDESQD